MELALMRYKGFTLWCNPLSIEVQSGRKCVSYTLPYSGEKHSDLGEKCRVIKGRGQLRGEDCLEQYAQLRALQAQGGAGVLSLPTMEPVKAIFAGLSAVADATPDTISYSFEFVEVSSEQEFSGEKTHTVKEGETLFDIAYEYSVSVDSLVALNTSVKRPDELNAGEEIKIC